MSECNVFGKSFRAQKDFSISQQERLSMSSMRVFLPGAQYSLWWTKKSFFLKFCQRIYIFEETKKSIQGVIGDFYRPTCPNEKCAHLSTYKILVFTAAKRATPALTCWWIPPKDLKPTIKLFGGDDTHCFARKTSRDSEKENPSPFSKSFFRLPQSGTPNT